MGKRETGRIRELSFIEMSDHLKTGRLAFTTGSLTIRCRSNLPAVAHSIRTLYQNHPYHIEPEFADFHIEVRAPGNLRRWFRRQAEFIVDGERPFEPLPFDQAPALFEWGLNWIIAASCHQWFTIHAASLERNGNTVILPAPPGSGKSTLCAALSFKGWRLLSDELTLLDLQTLEAQALARAINLKNASIDLIKDFAPQAQWAPETYDTQKGRVTHLAPSENSVSRMLDKSKPRWIVFPRYAPDAEPKLTPRPKSLTCLDLADNAFNYSPLGKTGFDIVVRLVNNCDCYDFVYSRIDDAIATFDRLSESVQVVTS
jgi:HprK-related kinase A